MDGSHSYSTLHVFHILEQCPLLIIFACWILPIIWYLYHLQCGSIQIKYNMQNHTYILIIFDNGNWILLHLLCVFIMFYLSHWFVKVKHALFIIIQIATVSFFKYLLFNINIINETIAFRTCSSSRCLVCSHSLVWSENYF